MFVCVVMQVYEALRARLRTECFQFLAAKIESVCFCCRYCACFVLLTFHIHFIFICVMQLGHNPEYAQYKTVAREAILKATEQLCSPLPLTTTTISDEQSPLQTRAQTQQRTPGNVIEGKRQSQPQSLVSSLVYAATTAVTTTTTTAAVSEVKEKDKDKDKEAKTVSVSVSKQQQQLERQPSTIMSQIDDTQQQQQREREKTLILASAFVGLCKHNPSLHAKFAQLRSLVLPLPLRQYIWSLALRNEDTMIKCAREAKQRAEVWNTTDMAKSPIHSLIDKLLLNVVRFMETLGRDALTPGTVTMLLLLLYCCALVYHLCCFVCS